MSNTIINKTETIGIPALSAFLAERHKITKYYAKNILDDVRDEIIRLLLKGKRVSIFGLGIFELRCTKDKIGRNPKTGSKIHIPAGKKVVFRTANRLKKEILK